MDAEHVTRMFRYISNSAHEYLIGLTPFSRRLYHRHIHSAGATAGSIRL